MNNRTKKNVQKFLEPAFIYYSAEIELLNVVIKIIITNGRYISVGGIHTQRSSSKMIIGIIEDRHLNSDMVARLLL